MPDTEALLAEITRNHHWNGYTLCSCREEKWDTDANNRFEFEYKQKTAYAQHLLELFQTAIAALTGDARDETIRQLHERIDWQNRIHLEIYHECDRELTAAGIPMLWVASNEPHSFTSKRIAALAAKVKECRDAAKNG